MSTVHNFPGGIHPHEGRGGKAATAGLSIVEAPQPSRVAIPLQQHIGAPCKPLVTKGDAVKTGQMIGEPVGAMSAAVHASISGHVVDCQPCILANGTQQMCVIIDNDFKDEWVPLTPVANPESMTVQELSDLARRMGIVGLGGATFPTGGEAQYTRWQKGGYPGAKRRGVRAIPVGRPPADAGACGSDYLRRAHHPEGAGH